MFIHFLLCLFMLCLIDFQNYSCILYDELLKTLFVCILIENWFIAGSREKKIIYHSNYYNHWSFMKSWRNIYNNVCLSSVNVQWLICSCHRSRTRSPTDWRPVCADWGEIPKMFAAKHLKIAFACNERSSDNILRAKYV